MLNIIIRNRFPDEYQIKGLKFRKHLLRNIGQPVRFSIKFNYNQLKLTLRIASK